MTYIWGFWARVHTCSLLDSFPICCSSNSFLYVVSVSSPCQSYSWGFSTKPNNHLSCDEKLQSFQISGSTLHCNFRRWGDESSFCGGCLTSLTSEQLRKSQMLSQEAGASAHRRWCFAQCEIISSETWCSGTGDVKESLIVHPGQWAIDVSGVPMQSPRRHVHFCLPAATMVH